MAPVLGADVAGAGPLWPGNGIQPLRALFGDSQATAMGSRPSDLTPATPTRRHGFAWIAA